MVPAASSYSGVLRRKTYGVFHVEVVHASPWLVSVASSTPRFLG